jgi:hypothetical protein
MAEAPVSSAPQAPTAMVGPDPPAKLAVLASLVRLVQSQQSTANAKRDLGQMQWEMAVPYVPMESTGSNKQWLHTEWFVRWCS